MKIQQPLPPDIARLGPEETAERIGAARAQLGTSTLILGHHYQRDEIIRWADHRGDSLRLSRIAASTPDASYIVFCGVHFMAESADILTGPEQKVVLPNMAAGCSMADMAAMHQVLACWDALGRCIDTAALVPITYVNSSAEIKAFVGSHGGACCTSSNARSVIQWALQRGERLIFFPDQHLGRNSCFALGMDPEADMVLWDPDLDRGGLTPEQLRNSKAILWKGHCSVHARFTTEQIRQARQEFPGVTVIVHPECSLDVVRASDVNGSTEYILKTVTDAAPGTTWAVGTEINLVSRMAQELPDRRVFCLDPVVCPCSTMYRIHPHYLLWVLESLVDGKVVNQVQVHGDTAAGARLALERMLAIA